jgi:5-methylcytosine-specific restriction protein A
MPRRPLSYRPTADCPSPPRRPTGPRLYDSQAWRDARDGFLTEHPLCADCENRGLVVSAEVVDHVIPHKGDHGLFWDRSNWRSLCITCHNRKTALYDSGFGRVARSDRHGDFGDGK